MEFAWTRNGYVVIYRGTFLNLHAEILLIKMILEFSNIKIQLPIFVHCNNIRAIYAVLFQIKEHIKIKHRFVREHVEKGMVKIAFVMGEDQR